MADPEIRIKVKVEDALARRSLSDFAREIPGVGKALELLRNPAAQAGAALAAMVVGVKAAIEAFAGAEEQSARLDAALARTGQLTDAYREKLHALAGQLQDTTGKADDEWLEVLRKLTQQGADAGNIDQLADGVKNLAGFLDGDLASAADMVGKALQGNFDLFGRLGIRAKDMTELLRELAEKGAGQLEARQKTLTGQADTLANSWDDLKEAGGSLIAKTGILQTGMSWLTTAFKGWTGELDQSIPKLAGLQNGMSRAKTDTDLLKRSVDELKTALAESKIALEEEIKVLDRRRTALNENARAADEIRNAELASEKSLVDRAVAAGQITPEEGMIQKQQIERHFAERGRQAEEARLAEEEALARQQLDALTAERERRQAQLFALRRGAKSDQENEGLQGEAARARQEMEARRAAMIAAQEGIITGGPVSEIYDRMRVAIAESQRFSGASSRFLRAQRAVGESTGSRERLAEAEAGFSEFEAMFQERGTGLIGDLQGVNRRRHTARRVAGFERQTSSNQDVVELLGTRSSLQGQQNQLSADFVRQIQGSGGQSPEVAAMGRLGQTILADRKALADRIARIEQELRYHKGWIGEMRNQ